MSRSKSFRPNNTPPRRPLRGPRPRVGHRPEGALGHRLGAVHGQSIVSLGVDRFGQSGDIPDLYRVHGIDTEAIVDAAARVCVMRLAKRTADVR